MSQKLKVRGAQLKREAAKSEEFKMGREQKPPAEPREETTVIVWPAPEPKTAR